MKKRLLALVLAFVTLLGAMPVQAFAEIADDGTVPTEPCTTEGCTLGLDHSGYCSNTPTYCQEALCKLRYKLAHEVCEYCETEGCSLKKEKHDLCVVVPEGQSADDPTGATDPTEACATDGCTLGKDHTGYCSNAPTYCENTACLLHYTGDHETCEYCATENCTLKAEAHTACNVPAYCENETCLLHKTAAHEVCEYCATENCKLKNEAHTECDASADEETTEPSTEATEATEPIIMKASAGTYAYDRDTGKPTNLDDDLYVAIYKGSGFPGEPAWYPWNNYTNFNSNFASGWASKFTANAYDVLKPEILNKLTYGTTTDDGTKVWGYYSAAGTKDMFVANSPLTQRENEETMIRRVKGSNVDVSKYEIVWYVIKFQTDTYWHIDGLVVEKETYNVNYYGNGSTSGDTPTGKTGLQLDAKYTVLGKNDLQKVSDNQNWTFGGWNTQPDGSGTSYQPGDVITIKGNVSLYAQWIPPAVDVSVTKIWNDDNNEQGLRPSSVTISLMNGTVAVDSATLSASNNWTHTWSELDAVDGSNRLITYTVTEAPSLGYTASYSGNQTEGFTVTNTIIPGLSQITSAPGSVVIAGQKLWHDKGNVGNTRPDSVTIILRANGTEVARTTASAPSWTYSFDISSGVTVNGTKLNPNNVTFTIDEVAVAGYDKGSVVNPTVSFDAPSAGEWNKISPCSSLNWQNTTLGKSIIAAKMTGNNPVVVWTPESLAPFERELVEASLDNISELGGNFTVSYLSGEGASSAYGIVVDNDSIDFAETKSWSMFFTGLYTNGSSTSTLSSIANVRNNYEVTVRKVWHDSNNQDGIRPDSVKVHLIKNNSEHVGSSVVLNESNGWTASWQVPLYDEEENLINYSVTEEAVSNYTVAYSGTADAGFIVTNSYEHETTVLNVRKAWDDANNQDNIRPASIQVQLYADDVAYGAPITLTQSGSFTGQWTNLPVYRAKSAEDANEAAEKIQYTVKEVGSVEGYTVTESAYIAQENLWRITNTHTTEKTAVYVEKKWEDANDQDGIRPVEIYVTLFQNGVSTGKTLTLTDTKLTGVFEDLEVHHGIGLKNVYTVAETGYKLKDSTVVQNTVQTVAPGYTASASDGTKEVVIGEGAAAVTKEYPLTTITNTHAPEKTSVYVKKTWEDGHNQDGIRPFAVEITLYADGVKADGILLSDVNGWDNYFSNLPKYRSGKQGELITYTVAETRFQRTEGGTLEDTVLVDGKTTIPTVEDGMHVAENVYVADIAEITDANGVAGYEVTNKRTPDTAEITVNKIWTGDNANQDQMRPYAVEITLLENGQRAVATVVLNAENSWAGKWTGITKFHNGQRISYSIKETGYYLTEADYKNNVKTEALPVGYSASHSYSKDTANYNPAKPVATITNTYNPTRTALNVQKEWKDADNRDGKRPASIQVQLRWRFVGDTEWNPVDNTNLKIPGDYIQTMSPENEWDVDFTDLPTRFQMKEVEYSAIEISKLPEGYTASQGTTDKLDSMLLINSYAAETTYVTVTKNWEDENDQDGYRPQNVTVTLYANGDEMTSYTDDNGVVHQGMVTLDDSNSWTHTFENLPKNQAGHAIRYTVVESAVEHYTTTYSTPVADSKTVTENGVDKTLQGTKITVTNTHEPEQIAIPVYKTWADNNNQDGIRPEVITVTLYGDGVAVGTKDLTISNGFAATFTDLDKYVREDGATRLVQYTIKETSYKMKEGAAANTAISIAEDKTAPEGYTAAVTATEENGVITQLAITNTHIPETVTVTATKKWDDDGNRDALRPASITLHLLKNNAHMGESYKQVVTGGTGDTWTATWENLPKYAEGYEIKYTVTEEAVADYTVTYDFTVNNQPVITNTHVPATRRVLVEKQWDDSWNQDNLRPESIRVKLVHKTSANGSWADVTDSNGTPLTLDIQKSNNWIGGFNDLPVKEAGFEIVYNVAEIGYTDAEGYHEGLLYGNDSVTYAVDEITKDIEVTNTHETKKTQVSVTKVWDDADNRDGIRPESIYVTLYKNGEVLPTYTYVDDNGAAQTKTAVVELNEANNWAYTYQGLELNYGIGVPCVYEVFETGYEMPQSNGVSAADLQMIPEGYEAEVTGDQTKGYTITNKHIPENTSLYVKKTWNDGNNQDGIRPYAVEITLYADNAPTDKKVILSNANGWDDYFTNLPKYKTGEIGEEIVYTVVETGYKMQQSDTAFTALVNGEIPNPDETKHLSGYTSTVSSSAAAGYVVTNTHTPDQEELTVNKVWADNNDEHKNRPYAVEITLQINGAPSATHDPLILVGGNWSGKWENLPKYQNGQRISYTVKETGYYLTQDAYNNQQKTESLPANYVTSYTYAATDIAKPVATVTNTYDPDHTYLNVEKSWLDDNNRDGIRPDSIQVQLYWQYKGETTWNKVNESGSLTISGDAVLTLSPENEWDVTFAGLPTVYDNRNVEYTAKEVTVPNGYEAGEKEENPTDPYALTITNTHVPAKTFVTVEKSWVDENNQDGIRPQSITVNLLANGDKVQEQVITPDSGGNWHYTFENLPVMQAGKKITYTVTENAVSGYTAAYGDAQTVTNGEGQTGITITVTNTHAVEKIDIPVQKIWVDDNNQDGIRPESVSVTLYADGTKVDEKELTISNGFAATFKDLDRKAAGQDIVYTIKETDVPDGYTATVSPAEDDQGNEIPNNWIVTNTHTSETVTVTATKVWNDDTDRDRKRPDSIVLHLLQNNKHMGPNYKKTVTKADKDSDGNWTVTWENLPKYAEGYEIKYTVTEETVGGYSTTYDFTTNTGPIITNSYTPETRNVTVEKLWDDSWNQDNLRPESIRVKLMHKTSANGSWADVTDSNGNVMTLDIQKSNNWVGAFTGLPVKEAGFEIVYNVAEIGYTDVNGQYHSGLLYGDNSVTYSVDEITKDIEVTNTHETAKTQVSVTKVWDDADNRDGIRPESIYVTLYKNGEVLPTYTYVDDNGAAQTQTAVVELNEANNWAYTYQGLELNYGIGVPCVYEVFETGYEMPQSNGVSTADIQMIPAGYEAKVTGDQTTGYTITNKHIPENTSLYVKKTWNDGNNQDGIRPYAVEITLYADGEATATKTVLSNANGWDDYFTNLPKYKTGEIGKEIVYTVVETGFQRTEQSAMELTEENAAGQKTIPVATDDTLHIKKAYEAEVTATTDANGVAGFEVTNSRTPDLAKRTVTKVWEDANNKDKMRPYAIEVSLLENGEPIPGKTLILSDGNWTGAWSNLPNFRNGQRISYSIKETGYYKTAQDLVNGNKVATLPVGYTATHSYTMGTQEYDPANPLVTITNTYKAELTALNVQKNWDDADNQDGIRPDSITVNLRWRFKGETDWNLVVANTGRSVMSPTTEWDADFENLVKYYDQKEVEYSAVEVGYTKDGITYSNTAKIPGYEATVGEVDALGSMVITNKHVPTLTHVDVSKTWEDESDRDHLRPASVTIQLYADGDPITQYTYVDTNGNQIVYEGSAVLNGSNSWAYSFVNLPLMQAGKEIVYTIQETAVAGYTASYDVDVMDDRDPAGNLIGKHTVIALTNTHEIDTMNIPVQKLWDDRNDNDGKRPDAIYVSLYADGTKVATKALNVANDFYAVFENLPVNKAKSDQTAGESIAITYTVKEFADQAGTKAVEEYYLVDENGGKLTADAAIADGKITLRNKHDIEQVTITAAKVWDDADDQDGKRPKEIKVHLFKDGVDMGADYVQILKADANGLWQPLVWSPDQYENLDKYAEGKIVHYTVYEDVNDLMVTGTGNSGKATAGEGAAQRIADRYVATYERLDNDPTKEGFYQVVMTNTYVPETTAVSAAKVWDDQNNRDGVRPESLIVSLREVITKADGTTELAIVPGADDLILRAENEWHDTWKDLPKYKDHGTEIVYTVIEEDVPGYNTQEVNGVKQYPTIVEDEHVENRFVITNKYDPATTEVKVTKIWEDEDNNDGRRPEGIVVQLRANASYVEGATAVLSEDNNWSYTFSQVNGEPLYVFQNVIGTVTEIDYDVIEVGYVDENGKQVLNEKDPVSGYVPGYKVDGYEVTITNTYATQKTSVSVEKVWEDSNNNDGKRPESVEVTLNLNGQPVASYVDAAGNTVSGTVTLSQQNGWKHTWSDLYVYLAGDEVAYTVTEKAVEGYEAKITGSAAAGFVITNVHEPEIWKLDITKVWRDNNSTRRPSSITVQLYKDGVAYGDSFKLRSADGWKYPVELPMYENGKKIEWTVKETKVPTNYEVSYDQTTLTITNRIKASKHNPRTGDFSNIGAWTGMMGTSGLGAALLMLLGKKKKPGKYQKS